MTITTSVALLITGILAGSYGTVVGAGGGFIFVPALLLFFNMKPALAAGSGLVIVLINALSGVTGYAKQNRIDYKSGIQIGMGAIPGSFIGVWLLKFQSSESTAFFWIFATTLVSLGIFLFIKNFTSENNRDIAADHERNVAYSSLSSKWFLPIGVFSGILSSYLGIGGGWLLVPILIYLFRFPTHIATATSIFSLCLYTSTGVLLQILYGHVHWLTVLWGGLGIIIGAYLGVHISKKISSKVIIQMLSILLIIMGVRLYFG
ncbi:MAG TPA: sulfite exporter TauE/SafE family protein [Lentibacillus sp.]|uniref:sulfite exporter TauE/SafE family protein n=1 Tax=Lentibacillus sp. TaxID=1925746 RepID=UPI002B4B3640|nr:sulfite exporter TauE/SafE family protein [Lentibacillus sp.]HLR61537.1 sulfite exporter TauE/SafE family protein [Lentibacillus sp.]